MGADGGQVSSSFLRHYDETKTLLNAAPSICLIGADAGQSRIPQLNAWRKMCTGDLKSPQHMSSGFDVLRMTTGFVSTMSWT